MKRFLAAAVIVVGAAAYVAGYWPEQQRRMALETEVAALRAQVADLEARVRGGRLLGQLLNVTEAVAALNYGQAQALSSTFFEDVRTEEARAPGAEMRSALEGVHQRRDAVTSALARGDASVMDTLRTVQLQLRELLGYPVFPTIPPPEGLPPAGLPPATLPAAPAETGPKP